MKAFYIAKLEDGRVVLTAYSNIRHLKKALRKALSDGSYDSIVDSGLLTVGVLSKYFINHHTFKKESLEGVEPKSKEVEKVWNAYRSKYISKDALKNESLEDLQLSKSRDISWSKNNLKRIAKNLNRLTKDREGEK